MSEDRLVAATQTHVYVLREIFDNLGSHYEALHDQHLVEINIDSGAATRFWPLRHMSVNHLETNDYLNPGQVTDRSGDVQDLMSVLREAGAQPISPSVWAVQELSIRNGALVRGEDQELMTPFAIRAAGRAQLAILREYYPSIESEEDYRKAEQIDFYDLYAEGDWDCILAPQGQSLFRADSRVLMAELRCEDADFSGAWSFHVLISEPHEN